MKAVKVEWIDSCASDLGWLLMEDMPEAEPIRIVTFGCLVKETDKNILVAQNYGFNPAQCSNLMTIPKGCITKMDVLEEIATENKTPLSAEILEKNGFTNIEGVFGMFDDYFDIVVSEFNDGMWKVTYHCTEMRGIPDESVNICYVYELQQFMEHCGIKKKIEI